MMGYFNGLKRQVGIHLRPNWQENNGNVHNKYCNPAQRRYAEDDAQLPHVFECEVNQLQANIMSVFDRYYTRTPKNNDEFDTAKKIRKDTDTIVLPSDKTKRLITLDRMTYHDFYNEHMPNYSEIRKILPVTRQAKFNKQLSEVAEKQEEGVRNLLLSVKCSDPLPSKMTLLPKDHKNPIRGRPLVSAVDTASTPLSRLLADVLNPLLNHVLAHLVDTSAFIESLGSVDVRSLNNCYYGSFDVSNLYGSIPLQGQQNVYSVVADFFNTHRNATVFRNVPKEDFEKLLKLTNTFDAVLIEDKQYKQKHGVAMGNNLSPLMAIIYMNYIEHEIRKRPDVLYWKRYIDDIFVVSSAPLANILPAMNDINPYIKFTMEVCDEHGDIPFLDTMVRLVDRTWTFSFYTKPLHSGYVMPWVSHVPQQQKISLLKSERQRILRICSSEEALKKALEFAKSRFLANGYPLEVINKFLLKSCITNRMRDQDNIYPKTYLRFPYICEAHCNKVRGMLRCHTLPVKIVPIFVTNPPLKNMLKKESPNNCGGHCLCSGKHLCDIKNVVYQIECKICHAKYIGQTMRTMRKRIGDHCSPHSNSMVFEHFRQDHYRAPTKADVDVKILQRNFKNTLERLEGEKLCLKTLSPSINRICFS